MAEVRIEGDDLKELLRREVMSLEVKFRAKGVRREDGKTAAEVEAELIAKENT